MTPADSMRDMPPKDDVPQHYKDNIAAHLKTYMRERRIETVAELERRLDVHSGTGTRLLKAQRCGLGVFIKIAKLLGGADYVLFEPPTDKGRRPRKEPET